MRRGDYLYTDRMIIPAPRCSVGQVVYVLESYLGRRMVVCQKLIRAVIPPEWVEGYGSMIGHWNVSYRYQDMHLGVPSGRMHSEYTLDEENIFLTEEEATIAMARDFVESAQREAKEIAREFKRLGLPLGDNIKQLNK